MYVMYVCMYVMSCYVMLCYVMYVCMYVVYVVYVSRAIVVQPDI